MRKRLLILLTAFVSLCAQAQYERQWGFLFPDNGSLEIVTAHTIGEDYLLVGSFIDNLSFGKDTLHSNGGKDVFILRIDTGGNIIKVSSFGTEGDDFATDIADLEGDLFILGHSASNNERSLFVVAFDENMTVVKKQRFPLLGNIHPDFLLAFDNKIIVGGSLKGVLQTGTVSIGDGQREKSFCIIISAEGEVLDTWSVDGTSPNRLHAMVPDNKGGCALVLNAGEGMLLFGNTEPIPIKNHAVILMDLDSLWRPVWVRMAFSESFAEATSMSADSAGIVVAINYSDTLVLERDTCFPSGGLSSLLINYDWNGDNDWALGLKSDEYCRLLDVCGHENHMFGTGYYYGSLSIMDEVLGQSAARNSFLVELDREGNLISLMDVGRSDPNAGYKMTCKTGSLLLTGTVKSRCFTAFMDMFSNKEKDGRKVEDSQEGDLFDHCLAELSGITTTETTMSLKLFPNPVHSALYWSADSNEEWVIELFDGQGKNLAKTTVKGQSGQIDVSPYSPGFYTLTFSSSNAFFGRGIIKY